MARVLVRLKLSLLRAGLRSGGTQGRLGFALALLFAVFLGGLGGGLFLFARLIQDARLATDVVAIAFGLLLVTWVLAPIVTAGAEGTLEPDRLALFPLSPRQLMPGMLLAAVVGFGGLTTVLVLIGVVGGTAPVSPLALITVAAVACELLVCVGASRLVTTAISGAARSRRWRDLALFIGPVLALVINLGIQAGSRAALPTGPGVDTSRGPEAVHTMASIARFLPSGPAALAVGHARDGRIGLAFVSLAGSVVVLVVAVALWGRVLQRVLTSSGGGAGAKLGGSARRPLLPTWLPFLPANRLGAVAAKELRLTWRDPRQRAAVLGALCAAVFPAFSFRVLFSTNPKLVLAAALPAYMLAATATNQYGYDGAAHWTNVAAGDDPAADLGGKNLARLLIALPFVLVLAWLATWRAGDTRFVLPALALAVAAFGVNLGLANVASVMAPLPMPDNPSNVFSAGNSGRGLAAAGPALGVMFGGMFLCGPLLLAMVAGSSTPELVAASLVAVNVGAVGWWSGYRAAVRRSEGRQPELLAALGPTRG